MSSLESGHSNTEPTRPLLTRRQFLKRLGATVAASALVPLAGCVGNSENQEQDSIENNENVTYLLIRAKVNGEDAYIKMAFGKAANGQIIQEPRVSTQESQNPMLGELIMTDGVVELKSVVPNEQFKGQVEGVMALYTDPKYVGSTPHTVRVIDAAQENALGKKYLAAYAWVHVTGAAPEDGFNGNVIETPLGKLGESVLLFNPEPSYKTGDNTKIYTALGWLPAASAVKPVASHQ
jgi:hypothetical protein